MHQKPMLVGALLSAVSLIAITSRTAESQIQGSVPSYVKLQSSTPGTLQFGHFNLNGTAMAGQFKGGGAGLTNLDATNITSGILDDSVLGPNVASRAEPNTFAVGPNLFYNGDGSNGTMALYAETQSTVAATVTGKFVNNSPAGTALVVSNLASAGGLGVTVSVPNYLGTGMDVTAGNIGLNSTSTGSGGVGVYAISSHPAGGTGLWGKSSGGAGIGVIGEASGSGPAIGGFFKSTSSTGFGVAAQAAGIAGNFVSSNNMAVSAQGNQYGVKGVSTEAVGGTGVYGVSNALNDGYGVWGQSSATNGRGVVGVSFGSQGAGGYFTATDAFATGLVATHTGSGDAGNFAATSGTGLTASTSTGNYAVRGENNSTAWYAVYGHSWPATGTGVGVLGHAESASGWGLYAFGRSGASGTKLFRIDHPLDPENKYLNHYSSESPEPINFYSGTVITDRNGEAWVTLPDYFASINKDFRYTLTVVDDTDSSSFVQVKVAKKIQGNRFKIRSSAGNTEVSWRVDARRNDLWVQRYGAPETTDKPIEARGKYQHPELYGKPRTLAEWYVPEKSAQGQSRP